MTKAINPNQFKLFMTGTEWKDSVTHSTDGPIEHVWKEKTEQAASPYNPAYGEKDVRQVHGAGLKDSLLEHGYHHDPSNPPTIVLENSPSGKTTRHVQSEGHHRIAAMADIESETAGTDKPRTFFVPTRYVDTSPTARAVQGQLDLRKRQSGN